MPTPVRTFIVAGTVLKQNESYLLVQENCPQDAHIHKKWNIPAGRVDEGESIEEAAVREAEEEAGLKVKLVRKLGLFQANANVPVKHAFEGVVIGGELKWPEGEILNAKWFTWAEIQTMQESIRDPWVIDAIRILEEK